MKRILFVLAFLHSYMFAFLHSNMFTSCTMAQNSRALQLQNAKNLTIVTNTDTYYYLVSSVQSQTMHRGDGKVVIQRDTFPVNKIRSMRFISLPRFSLSEDSTTIATNYSVNHGLLALRRSMNINTWNSLVLPFSLTGQQVRETFGDGCLLAQARGVTEGDVATVEFNTIPLTADETVIEEGGHYLIRPTREPDLLPGEMTSVEYGGKRIVGPVYLIPNVTLNIKQTFPNSQAFRSDQEQVRLRFYGTYVAQNLIPDRDTYLLNDEGCYALLNDQQTLKAFRSWIEITRNYNALPLRFYIDGVADITQGIDDLMVSPDDPSAPWYDLQGRKVSQSSTQKVLIHNGKKYFTR